MKHTTIKVDLDTKELLDLIKPEKVPYNKFLLEMLDLYLKEKINSNEKLKKFLEELDIDIETWKKIVVEAYRKLGIKDLEKIIENDPEMAKKIIKNLK